MKKAIYTLLTIVILASTATAEKWELIESNHTIDYDNSESQLNLRKMLTLNGVFYALNYSGKSGLIKSKDKGITWDTCFFAANDYLGTTTRLYDLVAHNNSLFVPADSGRIYHSFDGGDTWSFTYLGDEHKHPIQHLKFVNDSVGFLGHMQKSGFLKTTDAGRTWNPLPDASDIFPEIFQMYNFVPVDENTIYFVGRWTEGYYFFKTTNGGKKWEKFDSELFPQSEYARQDYSHLHYTKPYFLAESKYKPDSQGNTSIMRSDDFISWEPVFISDTIGGGKNIHDIQYFDDTMIGLGYKVFIYSVDNGNTWVDLYDETDEFYSRNNPINGFIYSDGYVYATGTILEKREDGLNYSIPRMYKYKFDLKTSVETKISNLNIYPNPAKEEINISYDKLINSIEILDLNGKKIVSNQYLAPQTEQSIIIEYLQSGTYFIRINDNLYKRFVKE